MDLSILIVNWNTTELLRRCLTSIQKFTTGITFEVIVVDNASNDGSAAMVRRDFNWAQLLPYPTNLGFSRANNKAAEVATGKVLCFLNADTELKENSLKILFDLITNNPRLGIIGCHLEYVNGQHQDSVRKLPTLSDQILILLKLHHLLPKTAILRRFFCTTFNYTLDHEVEQIMGAVMMITKENFRRVGGFDERFYLWFEEVDLQKRLKERFGLKNYYTCKTSIIHHHAQSFVQTGRVTKQRLYNQSMRYFFYKHGNHLAYFLCLLLWPISLFLAWISIFFNQNLNYYQARKCSNFKKDDS